MAACLWICYDHSDAQWDEDFIRSQFGPWVEICPEWLNEHDSWLMHFSDLLAAHLGIAAWSRTLPQRHVCWTIWSTTVLYFRTFAMQPDSLGRAVCRDAIFLKSWMKQSPWTATDHLVSHRFSKAPKFRSPLNICWCSAYSWNQSLEWSDVIVLSRLPSGIFRNAPCAIIWSIILSLVFLADGRIHRIQGTFRVD